MSEKKNNDIINSEEFEVAENETAEYETAVNKGVYVHKFSEPFVYEGNTYNELTFDWKSLTGEDSLSIENEMQAVGKYIISPEFSGEYLSRMAAHACTSKIGSDVICAMPLRDYNKIRREARSFLLNSGL